MKMYGIYFYRENGKSLSERFKETVKINNNRIDNIEYHSLDEAISRAKEYTSKGYDKEIAIIIYVRDTNKSFPDTYKMLSKKEIGWED